jgi:hypothetical protein
LIYLEAPKIDEGKLLHMKFDNRVIFGHIRADLADKCANPLISLPLPNGK